MATDERVPSSVAAVAVGAALPVCIFIAAPVTGGAVNPARALGPAIVSGQTQGLWLYLLAPVVGGVLAALLHQQVLAPAHVPTADERR